MITPRLEMILRHTSGKSCADIGTDHAYVPIELTNRGMRVIATDIMPGPLKIAAENVKKNGVEVELRLGGGLTPIKKGETDCIIIAGMGGEMIEKILSGEPEKAKAARLVLQPMNRQCELRKFLLNQGFCVLKEDLAVEGFKVYNLLVAEYTGEKRDSVEEYGSEIDYHLPKCLYENPHFNALLQKKKREFTKILSGLLKSKEMNNAQAEKLKKLLHDAEKIERSLNK